MLCVGTLKFLYDTYVMFMQMYSHAHWKVVKVPLRFK